LFLEVKKCAALESGFFKRRLRLHEKHVLGKGEVNGGIKRVGKAYLHRRK
jgi:hypothetical protein